LESLWEVLDLLDNCDTPDLSYTRNLESAAEAASIYQYEKDGVFVTNQVRVSSSRDERLLLQLGVVVTM
jgi:hypothetical protein